MDSILMKKNGVWRHLTFRGNVSDGAGIVNIFVDGIRPVTWNKTAYDRLVLPPQTKELVKALVTVRTSQRGAKQGLGLAGKREDIIAGKGNGLIMLLHGGPGTGKSLTAGMRPSLGHSICNLTLPQKGIHASLLLTAFRED